METNSTINFWLGSKYASWQYMSKKITIQKIFPQLCKTFCVIIHIMHILFCRTNQINVLQKEIKDWTFEVYLLTGETSFDSYWLNHWKWLVLDPMRGSWIFCQMERVWTVFRGLTSSQTSNILWTAQSQ